MKKFNFCCEKTDIMLIYTAEPNKIEREKYMQFQIEPEKEKIFILLDGKKCGYLEENDKNSLEINFAVNYQNKPGFRFIKVKLPSFPSIEKWLEYLEKNKDEICRSFSFHFFP